MKQRNPDGFFNFRWIMVDDVLHLRFLEEFLPIECERQHLQINREWLFGFESCFGDIKPWWQDKPATYEKMSRRYQTLGRLIALCDAKPAEDAPEWLLLAAVTVAIDGDISIPIDCGLRRIVNPQSKGHAVNPSGKTWVCDPITGDEWQVDDPPADNDPTAGTAETAPPAEEAQPPARDEAEVDWGEAADELWVREVKASTSIGR